jgi:hypothetical protein
VKRQIDNDLTHYCDPQGILPLRETIARDMGEKRGLKITPDRVVVFPGKPHGLCQGPTATRGQIIYPSGPDLQAFTRQRETDAATHLRRRRFSFTGPSSSPHRRA